MSRKTRLGSVVAVASLVVAVPATTISAAHADPESGRVVVKGTASCERFEDASVTQVTITPKGKAAKTDRLSGEDVSEPYSLTFTKVPTKGWQANAKVTCVDEDNEQHIYGKSFKIQRPADPNTEEQVRNLK